MKVNIDYNENNDKVIRIFNGTALISEQIEKKIPDSVLPINKINEKILKVKNSIFYLPNYADDLIQNHISHGSYFDEGNLNYMSKFINENSVVIDIGANIGNHTLYFANECNVKKVYSFEPIPYTFSILKKNIEINKLDKKVEYQQAGLSDNCSTAGIKLYDTKNIGGTRLTEIQNGDIPLITLDSLNIQEKIDLIKIDVETMDYKVLCGAKNTIEKSMPVISVESFDEEREYTDPFLRSLGYKEIYKTPCCEYIYVPENSLSEIRMN